VRSRNFVISNIYVITGTNLRRAATFAVDSNVRAAATKLQDHKLLSKLASGDMHALDAYYHPSCLTALYNRVRNIRPLKEQEDSESSQVSLEAIALAELVMYIEEATRPMVFQLSDLAKMYSCLLEQLGGHVPGRVNSTRLKDRLLALIPELGAYTEGKDTEAMYLAKAAMLVRKELLDRKQCFNGTFDTNCQRSAVPHLLLALVNNGTKRHEQK